MRPGQDGSERPGGEGADDALTPHAPVPPRDDAAAAEEATAEEAAAEGVVPVTAIERETGLTREVIRKWESRYGFPRPLRDGRGDRLYPADQVMALRLIRRLLDAGMRPSKVVGLDPPALDRLVRTVSTAEPAAGSEAVAAVLAALRDHDHAELVRQLRLRLHREGLFSFVRNTVAPLNAAVGEEWLRGALRVSQEHLYSKAVSDVVQTAISAVAQPTGRPRVLLTTPPGEHHALGLLMVEAVLAVEGAQCIGLGAQTPVPDLVATAEAHAVDVVGLSFSLAHPVRTTVQVLKDVRAQLCPDIELWAGGMGVARLSPLPGVRLLPDLEAAAAAVAEARERPRAPRGDA